MNLASDTDPDAARITLVIPVFNEAAGLKTNIGHIHAVLRKANVPHRLLLVDDGSTDATWPAIIELADEIEGLDALRLSRNFGKEAALCAGLDHVTTGACVCMDADLQHPPELIPRMYALWREGRYKIIEGVKQQRGQESLPYRWSSGLFYWILRKTAGINLRDSSDFRLLDRTALQAWQRLPEKQTFFRGMSSWIGFPHTQLSFDVPPRRGGRGKWSLAQLTRLAVNAITSYTATPLYLSALVGLILMLLSLPMMAQTLYMKLSGHALDGFTTVIMLQLIIGGTLLMAVGVIGFYVEKIYEEVKGRPRYLIAARLGSENTRADDSTLSAGAGGRPPTAPDPARR